MSARTRDRARRTPSILLATLAWSVICACAKTPGFAPFTRAQAPTDPPPIATIQLEERPALILVEREGDPAPATALVLRHGRGGPASTALSGLLLSRLEALGLRNLDARAHGLGIEISYFVGSSKDLERFFQGVRRALNSPVRADEAGVARARRELATLGALRFSGEGERAVAACSGELGVLGSLDFDLEKPEVIEKLEEARVASFRAAAAALSVVGPEQLVADASAALASSGNWPTGAPDPDPWPDSDVSLVDRDSDRRQLSVALRIADTDAAIGAAELISREGSDLLARLQNLTPAWELRRASAIARRHGACLRLDVSPPAGDPGPDSAEVARVATLIEMGAHNAFELAQPGAFDQSVLRPTEPRRAAVLAAWRALPTKPANDAPVRRSIAYLARPHDAVSSADLARGLEQSRSRIEQPSLELRERQEPGQGELWMLLASPCGATAETLSEAGALALSLQALARGADNAGVQLEPWISPDGVGLLAHAPRRSPAEGSIAHAVRVAGALGRALMSRLGGPEIGGARAKLLEELGGRRFEGLSMALDGLSPEHPSWLEPRGLWQSVSDVPTEALDRARRRLIVSPLRLGILSQAPEQARVASQQLESWLLPWRVEPRECPAVRPDAARRGEAVIAVPDDSKFEGAYVGVTLEPPGPPSARAAQLSALILNRSGGRLDKALASIGAGASAQAHALGGSRRPVVLITVRALPERLSAAVEQVRSVLEQLARGAVTPEEFAKARRELAQGEARSRFDPRRRIVDLWHGERPAELGLEALRAAQAGCVRDSHWVVSVQPR